jgi:hypothetical protein
MLDSVRPMQSPERTADGARKRAHATSLEAYAALSSCDSPSSLEFAVTSRRSSARRSDVVGSTGY